MAPILNMLDSHLAIQYAIILLAIFIVVELLSRLDPSRAKRMAIIGLSILFLGWLDLRSLALLTLLSSIIFGMVRARLRLSLIIYPLSLILIALLLLIKDLSSLGWIKTPYVPLGVSYYFFRLISFLIEYSKKPEKMAKTTPLDYFSWIFFFPIFLAGPILRFNEFKPINRNHQKIEKPVHYRNLALAIFLKVLLVDLMLFNLSYVTLQGTMELKLSSGLYMQHQYLNILYLFAFSFTAFIHAYLDLMLYTEISKALSGILGFTCVDNFKRPLLASNISEFWQRWHLSLSNWTRDYIFFPMLIKTRRTWPSTYASMLILGIWHAISLNWIVWAISHATAINLYGELRNTSVFKKLVQMPTGALFLRVSGNIITVAFVGFVFIFVAIHDFSHVIKLLSRCF
jgi:alginate O-acetyltransferase complex protein AlgI